MSDEDSDILNALSDELAQVEAEDVAGRKARAALESPELQDKLAKLREAAPEGHGPFGGFEKMEPAEALPSDRQEVAVAALKPMHQATQEIARVKIDPAYDPRKRPTGASLLRSAEPPALGPKTVGRTARLKAGIEPERPTIPTIAERIAEDVLATGRSIGGNTRKLGVVGIGEAASEQEAPLVDGALESRWMVDGDARVDPALLPSSSAPGPVAEDTPEPTPVSAAPAPQHRKGPLLAVVAFLAVLGLGAVVVMIGKKGPASDAGTPGAVSASYLATTSVVTPSATAGAATTALAPSPAPPTNASDASPSAAPAQEARSPKASAPPPPKAAPSVAPSSQPLVPSASPATAVTPTPINPTPAPTSTLAPIY